MNMSHANLNACSAQSKPTSTQHSNKVNTHLKCMKHCYNAHVMQCMKFWPHWSNTKPKSFYKISSILKNTQKFFKNQNFLDTVKNILKLAFTYCRFFFFFWLRKYWRLLNSSLYIIFLVYHCQSLSFFFIKIFKPSQLVTWDDKVVYNWSWLEIKLGMLEPTLHIIYSTSKCLISFCS